MRDKSRLIIGIVGYATTDIEKLDAIAIYDSYKKMIIKKNCIPLILPPIQSIDYINTKTADIPLLTEREMDIYKEMLDMCDGLLLPGGTRIYSYHKFITSYALEKDMPILGTCLGMQVLACIDNIDRCIEKNVNENHKKLGIKYAHKVDIVDNTLLSKIVGEKTIDVNSAHSLHITHVNKFIVNAYSEDGLIEGIELPGKEFVLGVQWHPEKMFEYDKYGNKIIDTFIGECKKYRESKKNI